MSNAFFERPIINSPYQEPTQHWAFNEDGLPTGDLILARRSAEFFTPIPKSKKKRPAASQMSLEFKDAAGLSTEQQAYETNDTIMTIRKLVKEWRQPDPAKWNVTPTTQRLLQWWRKEDWPGRRPFYCQIEAAEVAIWLTEVAPQTETGRRLLEKLESGSRDANPELNRLALKLATGAGKTTVMAMLIAWHTLNAVRSPGSKRFAKGFLIVAPGITIRDRLRVLMPNDPDNYYRSFQLVPPDMTEDLQKARIVITNYHAFKLRERLSLAKGTRELLQGRGPEISTLETEGQMIQRVMPDLMGLKNILVINDEAHHCYREKPIPDEEGLTIDDLKGEEKEEAKQTAEAARMWISGLEAVQRKLGIARVIDLSATPFFLRGSGYVEGTIFPWTACDFSLMDAIECGIVKLPRVPVADNIPGVDVPIFRNLWEHIGKDMPKKNRQNSGQLDPLSLPTKLQTALEALYGHYQKTFELWEKAGISVPPSFIIVCNNTATSKLVYDYISGFRRENGEFVSGRLDLFSNFDKFGEPLPRPNTLLIDSSQLESGEALDSQFREAAGDELERFRREIQERTGQMTQTQDIDDAALLREVMNTVGEKGKLGESIRCVVSVSMLTEGWDCNTVTHILGVRAFGTQLLCEQVVGRALRRRNYELNSEGRFEVEYADILGVPFNFAAEAVQVPPRSPVERLHVKAVRPEREALEICFPRIQGYRTEALPQKLEARFTDDHTLRLTQENVGPTSTQQSGIIGQQENLTLEHTADTRQSTIVMHLTSRLLTTKFRDPNGDPQMHLFGTLKRIVKNWLDNHLECVGNTFPAQLLYQELADRACNRINDAINRTANEASNSSYIRAITDPYNPLGSSHFVNFHTTKPAYETRHAKCPVNYVVLDSDWEAEFCRIVEQHPRVLRYVKNQSLGFEVPYLCGGVQKMYLPDFIVWVDDGHGDADPLQLIVEIKGYRREDAKDKANTMRTYWIPGVNRLKAYGRWAFAEFKDVYMMEADFAAKIQAQIDQIIQAVIGNPD